LQHIKTIFDLELGEEGRKQMFEDMV